MQGAHSPSLIQIGIILIVGIIGTIYQIRSDH